MANILTADEAARVVVTDPTDGRLLDVLPQVDAYIEQSTGRDWTQDSPVNPVAKNAARLKLALEYDLASMPPSAIAALQRALISALGQLEAIAEGMAVLAALNAAWNADDMLVWLTSDALGLNLLAFNRLLPGTKRQTAQTLLYSRPPDGYADTDAVQAALDTVVKAVTPGC